LPGRCIAYRYQRVNEFNWVSATGVPGSKATPDILRKLFVRFEMPTTETSITNRARIFLAGPAWLIATGVAVATAIAIASQLGTSPGDEGLHLLASQLLKHGKWPYLHFLYHHPPGYISLNAIWMSVFGESWRSAHALSALLTLTMIAVICEFTYTRFRGTGWEVPATAMTALLVGLNVLVLQNGVSAQPFPLTSLLSVVAFRLAVASPGQPRAWLPFWSGLCAGAACISSLLIVTVPIVLFIWLFRNCPANRRKHAMIQFLAGMVAPAALMIPLVVRAFPQVVFDLLILQLRHRTLDGHWTAHDAWSTHIHTVTDWLGMGQGLLFVLLPLLGLGYLASHKPFDAIRRSELYLCGWVGGALCAWVSVPNPTFPWYYMPAVPFAAVLAVLGLFAIHAHVLRGGRLRLVALLLVTCFVFSYDTAKWLSTFLHDPNEHEWREVEAITEEIRAKGCGSLYASDMRVYFGSRCPPQPGMESYAASWLSSLSQTKADSLHIVRQDTINRKIQAGDFSLLVLNSYDPRLDNPALLANYDELTRFEGHTLLVSKRR
jgi:hypothetical protein